ncbi:MAG: hypothetical protein MMC33_009838 [Icmadophila ericetorum]|nr:hypothetical protein [Icmadophila ericetorum]
MDVLLGKVTQQAMNYAIRSGISITVGYALQQSARLVKNVEGTEKEELLDLEERLASKVKIIAPAIDMIEMISARGNTSLESAVSLTKSLRYDIQTLSQRVRSAVDEHESARRGSSKAQTKAQNQADLKRIIQEYRKLLGRIEDAVPLISLAITTSGVSLSTNLPATVSPSRLLQASTFLSQGDIQYNRSSAAYVQIGPTFTLSLYMLFSGHLRPQDEEELRESTWKEVMHKAKVKLLRVPIDRLENLPEDDLETELVQGEDSSEPRMEGESKGDEFAYQLLLIEDHEDDRVHTYEEDEMPAGRYNEVELAGIREVVPVHQISKIFYADTGKVLNIGRDSEVINPVLLLKRDKSAPVPRTLADRASSTDAGRAETPNQATKEPEEEDENDKIQSLVDSPLGVEHVEALPSKQNLWRFPQYLDPEWLALEVYTENEPSDTESDTELSTLSPGLEASSHASPLDSELISSLAGLRVNSPAPMNGSQSSMQQHVPDKSSLGLPAIRSSLSLLDMLLRLLVLQQVEQASHLAIPDEKLNFFLVDAATTGGEDEQRRRRLREDTRRRVGFDPYDESPIKIRGENVYTRHEASQAGSEFGLDENGYPYGGSSMPDSSYGRYGSSPYDEGYETNRLYSPTYPQRAFRSSREATPETPPLFLKDYAQSLSSRYSTPNRANSLPPLPSSSPLQDAAPNRMNSLPPIPGSSLGLPSSPTKHSQQPRRDFKGSVRTGASMKQPHAVNFGPAHSSPLARPENTYLFPRDSSPSLHNSQAERGQGAEE